MRADGGADWSRAQRRLHWTNAALILLAFPIAWVMVAVPFRELLLKFVLFQVHKTLGLLVLMTGLARVFVRVRHGRPEWDAGLPRWQRKAAERLHVALYILLLLVPVLGYLVACTAPIQIPTLFFGIVPVPALFGVNKVWFPVLLNLHRAAAIALVLLAAGHAAAAVHNHRRGRNVLRRMWSG
ncbi:MAG: cytochrome b/b6 domain-containing protein [Rhodospirillales bacterium]|nr:cytochrome b/b6 domain-containing protein [Rhodospirillales bacterium]